MRLDQYLAAHLDCSVQHARRLLGSGSITTEHRTLSQSDKGKAVTAGQSVRIDLHRHQPKPCSEPLDIVYQADDCIIVNKPAGLAMHPVSPDETDTLLGRVVHRFPQILKVLENDNPLKAGVVHRLDTATSGLVFFALTPECFTQARQAFANHTTDKRYLALVLGCPPTSSDTPQTIELPLKVTQHKPARVAVASADDPQARLCKLDWSIKKRLADATLINIRLHTGFLHQIRATFAHLGHPILGDTIYQSPNQTIKATYSRLMLHAYHLSVLREHAECDLPDEFQEYINCINIQDLKSNNTK